MLYLIEDRDYLKIGYTANVEDRKKHINYIIVMLDL